MYFSGVTLWFVGGLPVSNTQLTGWLVCVVLVVAGAWLGTRLRKIPGYAQVALESAAESLLTYLTAALRQRELALQLFPVVATLFLYVVGSGVLGVVFGSATVAYVGVSGTRVPVFSGTGGDVEVWVALGVLCLVVMEWMSLRTLGVRAYATRVLLLQPLVDVLRGVWATGHDLVRGAQYGARVGTQKTMLKILGVVLAYHVPVLFGVPVSLMGFVLCVLQGLLAAMLLARMVQYATQTYTWVYVRRMVRFPHKVRHS